MPAGIFLIRGDNELVELTEQPYVREDLLQQLLARYPNLLAGDQINPTMPRRWLLVRRELAVPDSLDAAGRWSLDHLFLDQDGVPTLVEVKRSSDTRARREVVAQMLDYAANGVAYWPVETIRAAFEQRSDADGESSSQLLSNLIGEGADVEAFWSKVKANLQAGHVRMMFVADEIGPELRRIVEFLNSQMDPAEVLAVEVKQYVGTEFRGLVPRLIGQTEEAVQRKSAGVAGKKSESWAKESFFAALAQAFPTSVDTARDLTAWLTARPDVRVEGGKGTVPTLLFYPASGTVSFLTLRADSRLTVTIQDIWRGRPNATRLVEEWTRRLNEVTGMNFDVGDGWPSREMSLIGSADARARLESALEWMLTTLANSRDASQQT